VADVQLDEINFFNKALSQEQIAIEMNAVDDKAHMEICKSMTISTTVSPQITTSSSTTEDFTSTNPNSCVGNYWPVRNNAVEDMIGGKSAYSPQPQFATDRFGALNGSVLVNSEISALVLPDGFYIQGDTTVTMWVKKIICGGFFSSHGPYRNLSVFFYLIQTKNNNIL
jgi:hypothetical protein